MTRNPFDEIERMFDRMSRQFESLEDDVLDGSVAVDVADRRDRYVVTADLPGYDREDIDVQLSGETVTLSASRDRSAETEEGRYIRRERRRQSASRSVRLPEPVDEEGTQAQYTNGVLTVTLPKRESGKGHDIPIN